MRADAVRSISIRGVLRSDGQRHWVENEAGASRFEDGRIWDGYARHWKDRPVQGRLLRECDYETEKPLVLLWPDDFDDHAQTPHFQIFLNERMPSFRGSLLGHSAVSVGGWVFNFSYRRNENEVLTVEEYLYRPALGLFGVHPSLMRVDVAEDGKPYYNNFGRLFSRSIHVLHVETTEQVVDRLAVYFLKKMDLIKNAPVAPDAPNLNPFFHVYRRNCATILRDGLRRAGPFPVHGITPRDLFESACRVFRRQGLQGECRASLWGWRQLKVPEAPYSARIPGINPMNWARQGLRAGARASGLQDPDRVETRGQQLARRFGVFL